MRAALIFYCSVTIPFQFNQSTSQPSFFLLCERQTDFILCFLRERQLAVVVSVGEKLHCVSHRGL